MPHPLRVPGPSSSAPVRDPGRLPSVLRVLGVAEAACDALPRSVTHQSFEVRGRQILRVGPDGVPIASVGPSPAHGEALRGPASVPPVRIEHRLAVDEVRLAKLGGEQLRMRAFYAERGATAAVHRSAVWRRPRLLGAARVRQAIASTGAVEVPPYLASGSRNGVAWLVEGTVEAFHPGLDQRDDIARELGPRLLAAGIALGWQRGTVREVLPARAVSAVRELLVARAAALPGWLPGRVIALVDDHRHVVLAPGHGDPVLSNVMRRTADGHLVLVDWELAGTVPVGQDAAKLVLGSADPLAALAVAEPVFARAARRGDLPWEAQVAVAVLRILASWRGQARAAAAAGRDGAFQRQLTARLALLGLLLAGRS